MSFRMYVLLCSTFTYFAALQSASAQTLHPLMRQASRLDRPYVTQSSCHPRYDGYSPGYGEPGYGSSTADLLVQNELAHARAFWGKRRLRQQYLDQQRERHRFTQYDVDRLREHQRALREVMTINYEMAADRARRQAPGRPDGRDVHPTSGDIHWPASLRATRFEPARTRLETIFAARARYDEAAWDHSLEIPQLTRSMRAELKSMIRDLPSGEYVAAKTLLNRLEYESRFPAASGGGLARK